MYTYKELLTGFRKDLRNGNWRKLRRLEKAIYMASLWYSRVQGAIINDMVVSKLSVAWAPSFISNGKGRDE